MDFIEFKFWKAVGFVALAFVWGLFCGVTRRDLNGRKRR